MDQTAGKPHHLPTLLHHLFKVQGLLVSYQRIEACLQTVVGHNPWFPDEGSFDLEIWYWVKENVERAAGQGENIPIDFWPLWALIKAVMLPFQGSSSPHNIRQQTEHLLHEYELNDETLQKAQLEQCKIFQNFPISLALAAPTPPPPSPLPAGTYPEVSPLLKLNDSDNDSPEAFIDTKTGSALMDNYDKSLTQTHTYKKSALIRFPQQQRL